MLFLSIADIQYRLHVMETKRRAKVVPLIFSLLDYMCGRLLLVGYGHYSKIISVKICIK